MKYSPIVILLILCFACGQPNSVPEKPALSKKIDSYLQESFDRLHLPGLAVAATRNDSVVYAHAFGYRNYDTKEPMKPTYNFHPP